GHVVDVLAQFELDSMVCDHAIRFSHYCILERRLCNRATALGVWGLEHVTKLFRRPSKMELLANQLAVPSLHTHPRGRRAHARLWRIQDSPRDPYPRASCQAGATDGFGDADRSRGKGESGPAFPVVPEDGRGVGPYPDRRIRSAQGRHLCRDSGNRDHGQAGRAHSRSDVPECYHRWTAGLSPSLGMLDLLC
ncbi:unnamed protein product, partial [Mycena citricolor]